MRQWGAQKVDGMSLSWPIIARNKRSVVADLKNPDDLTFVQQQGEFFDLDSTQYGLKPVQCDVWNGFIFINFDPEPRWTLREFLGPMITALDDYPFEMMTERYEFEARNNSNNGPGGYRIVIALDRGGQRDYDVSSPGDLRVGDRVTVTNGQIARY